MPCYTVNMVSLELNARNKDLIVKVLQDMRLNPVIHSDNTISSRLGTFDLNINKAVVAENRQNTLNQFKVNYSKEILKTASERYKFSLKQDAKNPSRFVMTRW